MILALVSIFAATLLFWIIRWRNSRKCLYKLADQLPGPHPLPLIGDALMFNVSHDDLYTVLTNVIAEYPTPMKFWLGPELIMIVRNPDQVEKLITSSKLTHKHHIYRFIQNFIGNGLISGSGPNWKVHRKLIQPLFHKKYIDLNIEILQHNATKLLNNLAKRVDGQEFDIHDDIHNCCMDFISEITYGKPLNAQNGENYEFIQSTIRMYELVFDRMMKVWLQNDFLYNFSSFKARELRAKSIINNFHLKVIEQARQRRKSTTLQDDSKPTPIVDMILEKIDESPGVMNNSDLCDHIATLFLAGEDPMTLTSAFTCYFLGMYPEYQDKAAKEVLSIFGPKPRAVTEPDLDKLVYLGWCINEVLRLCPIGPFILRQPMEDFSFEKYVIPKGCAVLISITNIHRDAEHYERPNDFFPDHFRPEAVAKRHPYAYLPFSAGQRGCIGKILAIAGLKTVVANILQNYRLEASGKFSDIPLKSDISVRPINGFPVRISKRVW